MSLTFDTYRWPKDVAHAKKQKQSSFFSVVPGTVFRSKTPLSLAEAVNRLEAEVRKFEANATLCGDFAIGRTGKILASSRASDSGVCLYVTRHGKNFALPCDQWLSQADNVNAIAAHIGAVRGIERWGVASIDQLMTAFAELPQDASGEKWWDVLEVDPFACTDDEVRANYRRLSKVRHPDAGGSHEVMAALNRAWDDYQMGKAE